MDRGTGRRKTDRPAETGALESIRRQYAGAGERGRDRLAGNQRASLERAAPKSRAEEPEERVSLSEFIMCSMNRDLQEFRQARSIRKLQAMPLFGVAFFVVFRRIAPLPRGIRIRSADRQAAYAPGRFPERAGTRAGSLRYAAPPAGFSASSLSILPFLPFQIETAYHSIP